MGNCQTYDQDELANVNQSQRGRLQLFLGSILVNNAID